ncbi:MAG: IgGFc-binding protein [Deltaproteobacteria bacterium]|nr:IgGFc-binding protein [Deltaproteobacteria bacterium]
MAKPQNRNKEALGIAVVALAAVFFIACHETDRPSGDDDNGTSASDEPDGSNASDSDQDTDFPGMAIPATCEDAVLNPTSVGCEFFMADLDNFDQADSETYAVVVSNPQNDQEANVVVTAGIEGEIFTTTLAPGQLQVIDVACASGCLVPPHEIQIQGLAKAAGFRLTSDVPVLAYQWNNYGIGDLYSTDASLLIPRTSLDGAYIVAAWGDGLDSDYRSTVTVVGIEDRTSMTFIPPVDVPQMGGVGPYTAGSETAPVTLDAFDVISLSPATLDADLTGTVVKADKPVVVFGGHACALVPNKDYQACDHVEEQILPLAAWGTSAVLARHAPRTDCSAVRDMVVWRVIAGADNMHVTFDPPAPSPADAEHHFTQQGEVLEFLAPGDYYAEGVFESPEDPEKPGAPFLAYQMMMGASYANCYFNQYDREGDPMMLQAPPAGQFLDRYVFNTDNVFDFANDHIIIVRPSGAKVALDCKGVIPDSSFAPVGSSDWEVARIFIDNPENTTGCTDGAHLLAATAPVGLSVVGTAAWISYGYLGGVGLKPINPVVVK